MLGAVTTSAGNLTALVDSTSARYGVESSLIKAIIQAESAWDINASRYEARINDSSWGLMQVLLSTARSVLGNSSLTIPQLIRPEINIEAGTKYISQLLGRYGNIQDAIASYNAGSPKKTPKGDYINQPYVEKVLGWYGVYQTQDQLAQSAQQAVEKIKTTAQNILPEGFLSDPIFLIGLLGLAGIGLIWIGR